MDEDGEAISSGMRTAQQKANALTRIQIQEALQINAECFDGHGLTNFPAILQALATNYSATRLFAKIVK